MCFDIITIFPNAFRSYFNESIISRGQKKGLVKIKIWDLRKFVPKKERVDDRPYGGGPGMVLKIKPLAVAISKIKKPEARIILLSAVGRQFNSGMAALLAKRYKQIILISGRYEGIDERIKKAFKCEEISIGPYVLTGGELPAMVVVDAVARHISGVLGKEESLEEKRHGVGVPSYTRPRIFVWKGKKCAVPQVLLSGSHKKIEDWKKKHKK